MVIPENASKHVVEFNGYEVGERLLDGVYFLVDIYETPTQLIVGEALPRPDAHPYIDDIRWERFAEMARERLAESIEALVENAQREGRSLTQELDHWEALELEEREKASARQAELDCQEGAIPRSVFPAQGSPTSARMATLTSY